MEDYKYLQRNERLQDLIQFIESRIQEFSCSSTLKKIIIQKDSETNITTAFNQYMMKGQRDYVFHAEVVQKGSHKADIMVLDIDDDTIMVIEAKILPTPTKDKKRKEHEYVYGEKGAGIQRFKEGNHGVDFQDNPLCENGMIAYIKTHDFAYWHNKVNQWIQGVQWDDSELLTQKYPPQQDLYLSHHPRKDGTYVTLHHFWVKV